MRALRTLLFLALAGALLQGPIRTQIFGERMGPWVRYWRMYAGYGSNVCDVHFSVLGPDGAANPIDRYKTLGLTGRADAPTGVWRMANPEAIHIVAGMLCEKLDKGADLRAQARCGRASGWTPVLDGSEPLCERPKP